LADMQNPLDRDQTIAVGELDAAAHLAPQHNQLLYNYFSEVSACFNHDSAIKLGWTAGAGVQVCPTGWLV
jgi:opacity protein-like surface antigen